jgi:hypothetical protein
MAGEQARGALSGTWRDRRRRRGGAGRRLRNAVERPDLGSDLRRAPRRVDEEDEDEEQGRREAHGCSRQESQRRTVDPEELADGAVNEGSMKNGT